VKINIQEFMPIVFIHCPYSNPYPPQMGRVWVENNYKLKKWGGYVLGRVQIIDWVCVESSLKLVIHWVWVGMGRVSSG
jgi:hypothetical protein